MFRIFENLPPVTKNLLIINVLIWGAMALIPGVEMRLDQWCGLHYFMSPFFNVAQLITYMFLHNGISHLFFNMFALVMFGGVIERTMGSKRFLTFYISCGIFAAIVQMGVYAIMIHHYSRFYTPVEFQSLIDLGEQIFKNNGYYAVTAMNAKLISMPETYSLISLLFSPTVGASGAIYGILLAFGMLYPNQPLYLFFIPIPIKAKYIVIGYGVIELLLGFGGVADGIAHFAHLGGMIAGIILILYWKKKGVFNNHWFF